ncbi:DUF4271 domain-containing protein [Aquimarina brevivitae]|uniref:Uncharacterized protein DUF4271 n=1 Tax=Aquimarina brevivitae TaxID=323412 RepID=A0A4V2F7F5_9FLAO|nr:DUF4271 domain-containing protein [Aquimarina brevivitae]RZS99639.1 uncharacterized protein DUF4271 [Aquimarina brevivitae]
MEVISREIVSTNWITVVFILTLTALLAAKLTNPLRFAHFISLFNSSKYVIFGQKGNQLSSLFNSFLIVAQALSISLFILICIKTFKGIESENALILFTEITFFYLSFIISKILIEKIVATVFEIETLIEDYVFYKLSYRNFLGIILLPFNIIFTYTVEPSKIVLLMVGIAVLLLNTVVLISIFKKNEKVILNHLLYFILYLCALEIAPYFVLYKLLGQ